MIWIILLVQFFVLWLQIIILLNMSWFQVMLLGVSWSEDWLLAEEAWLYAAAMLLAKEDMF